jgi:hypothetical protein
MNAEKSESVYSKFKTRKKAKAFIVNSKREKKRKRLKKKVLIF